MTTQATQRMEVRVTGFGGQGVILAGHIIGQAVALYQDRYAALAQNYGPEARGSACRADVILSGDPIDYPAVFNPQLLLVLSQDGYTQHKRHLREGGLLIYDEGLVRPEADARVAHAGIPATRFAQEAGHKIMANIAMLGFLTALTDVVGLDEMTKAVSASVPPGTDAKNLKAFQLGYDYGLGWLREHGSSASPLLRAS